jgi:thiol-disulfide isomerase/thioredoxin
MKKICILLTLVLIVSGACKTTKPVSSPTVNVPAGDKPAGINYHDQTTWILGYFKVEQLKREPHSDWFMKGYDDYEPATVPMNNLLDFKKDNLTIKVIMGTWCPDSRREVPRFMKLMDIWQMPDQQITFIGVDDAKKSPVGEYTGLGIERVPTFIFYKNNVEVGRIIENPRTSLEQDIVNILNGMNTNK